MKVAIIGAGISGLALAYYLQKLGIRYDLFESSSEVGGMVKSRAQSGYQLELGPHALQMNGELQDLLQELKLDSQIIWPAQAAQQRFILRNGKFHSIPTSPLKLLLNSFFSWHTKLQISQEVQKPRQEIPGETVGHFFLRRFGQEVVDYLVQPLVAGVYGGDPDTLLLEKTFPAMKELERAHGSVLKGLVKQHKGEPSQIFTLAPGLQALPNAIASKLVSLHLDHEVEMIHKNRGKFFLSIRHDQEGLSDEEYDLVVLALPAHAAAELLEYTAPGLSAALQNVNYAPLTVVHTAYRKQNVGFTLNGLGALHPGKENPVSTGSIWSSSVFPAVCPEGEVLFSSFVHSGPASAAQVPQKVHRELQQNYSISGSPLFQHCHVWPKALPQPDQFILDVHRLAEVLEEEHLFACANWVAGPAVRDCIAFAKSIAQKIYSRRPSFQ
ncbi:protoporphyrinogen oxidase [Rufibacter ruber]|uniref:protoporphyrinogen oxidase n=1 Tax=Rufibacter ruber TaxID=1783499 RepID=UPI00083742A1|nr:protoporphyrinogen oxidase [Rufibacter ruber]